MRFGGRAAAVLGAGSVVLALALAPAAGSAAGAAATSRVIVQAAGDPAAAVRAVSALGGSVTRALPIVDGFAATVPASAVPRLRAAAGVRAVTPDLPVALRADETSTNVSTIKNAYPVEVGADTMRKSGFDGSRVGGAPTTVALVDTGVSAHRDLAGRVVPVADPTASSLDEGRKRLVECVNFSGEAGCADSYGHGTFLAGLIAGNGASSGGQFAGVAPGAQIVSIKIAGRSGAADVTKLLAAIQWAVSFRAEYGIGVLNLSLGTDSTTDPEHDPLNLAVRRAWKEGIVVVVAAGNRGAIGDNGVSAISKPADDPVVLTAGAVDDRQTPGIADDRSPRFSSRGPTAHSRAKPDVVAPGAHLVSLRAPSSWLEEKYPAGVNDQYRRGTGTSMSAAVVSGVVSLVRQAKRDWTPDQVKSALMSTAAKVAVSDPLAVGAGLVHAPSAVAARPATAGVTPLGSGEGPLDAHRRHVETVRDCTLTEQLLRGRCVVMGAETAQGRVFDAAAYSAEWTGTNWYTSQWAGTNWYGTNWYGTNWYGTNWYGSDWSDGSDSTESYGEPYQGSASYGTAQ